MADEDTDPSAQVIAVAQQLADLSPADRVKAGRIAKILAEGGKKKTGGKKKEEPAS